MASIFSISWKTLILVLLFPLIALSQPTDGIEPRQIESAPGPGYIMLSLTDTAGVDDFRYGHVPFAGLFAIGDSTCWVIGTDTVCIPGGGAGGGTDLNFAEDNLTSSGDGILRYHNFKGVDSIWIDSTKYFQWGVGPSYVRYDSSTFIVLPPTGFGNSHTSPTYDVETDDIWIAQHLFDQNQANGTAFTIPVLSGDANGTEWAEFETLTDQVINNIIDTSLLLNGFYAFSGEGDTINIAPGDTLVMIGGDGIGIINQIDSAGVVGKLDTFLVYHENTSDAPSMDNSGGFVVQDVIIDTFGHVTSLVAAEIKVVNDTLFVGTEAYPIDTINVAGNTNFYVSDDVSTEHLIVGGDTLTVLGGGINVTSLANDTLTITGTEVDGDITNEIQVLSGVGDTIFLSDPTGTPDTVILDGLNTFFYLDADAGTVHQLPSEDTLRILGGGINTTTVSGKEITVTATEVDGSITNELQTLSGSLDTVFLSNPVTGPDTVIVDISQTAYNFIEADAGPPGYQFFNQDTLRFLGTGIATTTLSGKEVTINATEVDGLTTNEIQMLSINSDTIFLTDPSGTPDTIIIPTAGTDDQIIDILGLKGDTLIISLENDGLDTLKLDLSTLAGGNDSLGHVGPANAIPFFDGSTKKANSGNLVWNDGNERFGIGTTSPGFPVHNTRNINGDNVLVTEVVSTGSSATASLQARVQSSGDYAVMQTGGTGNTFSVFGVQRKDGNFFYGVGGTKKTVFGSFDANDAILGTNNTARVTIGGSNGSLNFSAYTAEGSFPVTAAGMLVFDASGNIGTQAVTADDSLGTAFGDELVIFGDGTRGGQTDPNFRYTTPGKDLFVGDDLYIGETSGASNAFLHIGLDRNADGISEVLFNTNSGSLTEAIFRREAGTNGNLSMFQTGTGDIVFNNGSDWITLSPNGTIDFLDYGLGNNTGTIAYFLGVDASGNVIEETVSPGAFDLDFSGDSGTGVITNVETMTFTGGTNITTTVSGNDVSIGFTGESYDLNVAGDTGSGVITDSETFTFDGINGIVTSMSGNTLTIDGSGIGGADELGSTVTDNAIVFGQGNTVADWDNEFTWNGTTLEGPTGLVIDNGAGELITFSASQINISSELIAGNTASDQLYIRNSGTSAVIEKQGHLSTEIVWDNAGNLNLQASGTTGVTVEGLDFNGNVITGPAGSNQTIDLNASGNITISTTGTGDHITLQANGDIGFHDASSSITTYVNPGSVIGVGNGPTAGGSDEWMAIAGNGFGFQINATTEFEFTATEVKMNGGTTGSYYLEVNGSAANTTGVWGNESDRRIKENIKPISDPYGKILQLKPVEYELTDEYLKRANVGDRTYRGYIAQEYQNVFPGDVQEDEETGYLSIEPNAIRPYHTAAIKQLIIDNRNLTKTLEQLIRRIDKLEQR